MATSLDKAPTPSQAQLFDNMTNESVTFKHPLTGVELNSIDIKRPSLDQNEAVTAHILRQQGHEIQTITSMLGTNQGRVAEVLNGACHPNAASEALKLLTT